MPTQDTEQLRYLSLLSRSFPTALSAYSEMIRLEAMLRLPKGTEHFMSDLHGENEAFTHILANASGVIREKLDVVLGDETTKEERADLATLVYYPQQKLPELKAKAADLGAWYRRTLLQLTEVCRFVSSKHTRAYVRSCLPEDCAFILDELLHAHFEDHDKKQYYGAIVDSMIDLGKADAFLAQLCALIKRLAVDRLHIVGDLFDRGPRPDQILTQLMAHHAVDVQWGNHDTVWMGAAAGSPVCMLTVLKTTLAYQNTTTLERGYGISLRMVEHYANQFYGGSDVTRWLPHTDPRRPVDRATLERTARMHKAVSVLLMKLEAQVIARNPDFQMQGRDYLRQIDYEAHTVVCGGKTYPLTEWDFPTVDPAHPEALTQEEKALIQHLTRAFRDSERLQRHVRFLYDNGSVYKCVNGNLLFHGAVPMTEDGQFAQERFEGQAYGGRALFDYCEQRARHGFFAPQGSPERQRGQDFLWYLWCGPLSPIFGRSAMTTFERQYISAPETHVEIKNPYYRLINQPGVAEKILHEFGLVGEGCHMINGHVPVRAIEGESPVKGGGRVIVIDGGFCNAYHQQTGIAGYTLVFNSRGMTLRTHQPFESTQKAIHEDEDIRSTCEVIYTAPRRLTVADTDEGAEIRARIADMKRLAELYERGTLREACRTSAT